MSEHQEIYNRYTSEDITQEELADEYGKAQSTVSAIVRRLDRQNETNEPDSIFGTFEDDDETDVADGDDYWCDECGADIDYLESECPNCGNNLDWGGL